VALLPLNGVVIFLNANAGGGGKAMQKIIDVMRMIAYDRGKSVDPHNWELAQR